MRTIRAHSFYANDHLNYEFREQGIELFREVKRRFGRDENGKLRRVLILERPSDFTAEMISCLRYVVHFAK